MKQGTSSPAPRKVLLIELNEITWRILGGLCRQGKLPMFSEFMNEGSWGTAIALEEAPYLDPWISWTTLYTGRPQEEHGVKFLEQPPETVRGPRVWELAADAGKTIGVYGSIMSWPPRANIQGFWVPSTFAPGAETYPPHLWPIQELNLRHTRAHNPLDACQRKIPSLAEVFHLLRLGLRPRTLLEAAAFLLQSKVTGRNPWKKVSLQPLINLDFFTKLYQEHQPDLATFHSNHVAHYQHRYWRSMDPTPFLVKPSAAEQRRFGAAIEYGYRVADRLLQRVWRLTDDNTVVIVASGLGQRPYVVEDFSAGREVVRIRDIHQIIELCGVTGACVPISMMAPQWNLQFTDMDKLRQAEQVLRGAWVTNPGTSLFAFETVGNTINVNISQKNLKPLNLQATCCFPDAGGRRFTLGELCVAQDATPKEGYHDPLGVVLMRGAGIRRGYHMRECTNLDFAPTMLHLLGVPIPSYMTGRVIEEALVDSVTVPVSSFAGRTAARNTSETYVH
ncbi:MAG: alkaline phosphatase family protein [Gemmataceae bacterium]